MVWTFCAAFLSMAYNAPVMAQAAAKFEVASIKLNTSGSVAAGLQALPGGRLHVENETIRDLIRSAYSVQDFQLTGGPGWINSERYDIEAKAEGNPPLRQIVGPILLALLEDRLQLKTHRETKELPIYALIAAKGGLKLKATACTVPHDPNSPSQGADRPKACRDSFRTSGCGSNRYPY